MRIPQPEVRDKSVEQEPAGHSRVARRRVSIRGILRRVLPALSAFCMAAMAVLPAVHCDAQQLLFSEDFSATTLDPAKWRIDNVPFESGTSDIAPTVGGGLLNFYGINSAGWWGGSAIATVPTFTASPETNLVFQVDRINEGGVGTASRSAIWITDATRQHFVFFGDNRGEGNWRYNRKIGATGDNATGGGTAISAFATPTFTDLGLHTIKAVVNGQSVKLYLDDVFGAEVAFPFSDGIDQQRRGER
jgi:hypothetical protein